MGTTTTTPGWATHTNPHVQRLLVGLANGTVKPGNYASAAAMCRAHGVQGKANQYAVRQVLRNAGQGVGRGRTYTGNVPGKLRKAAQHVHKQATASAKQAAKASAPTASAKHNAKAKAKAHSAAAKATPAPVQASTPAQANAPVPAATGPAS